MPQAYGPVIGGKRTNVRSIPKLVRVNADDDRALIYRNLGNGRRLPLLWGTAVTLASGTNQQTVVASGIEFHGFRIVDGIIEITPVVSGTADSGGVSSTVYPDENILGKVYVIKDYTHNQIIIRSTVEIAAGAQCPFDVYVYFGTSTSFNSTDSNQIWKRMHIN